MLTANEIVSTLQRYRSCWFDLGGRGEVYIRRSHRLLDGKPRRCLDLANVEVKADQRKQGVFSDALALCEVAATRLQYDCVYVEAVGETFLTHALGRRGYTLHLICDGLQVDAFKRIGD